MSKRCLLMGALLAFSASSVAIGAEATYRMTDGITAFVNNPAGKDFTVSLDVRDINIYETGPREVLVKIYDPDGRPVVREIIPDDGVTSPLYQQPVGAWDHEAWYYAHSNMMGLAPAIRWSAFSQPDRLGATPKRTFTYKVAGGKKGIFRILLVGAVDHYVSMNIDPNLPYGVCGNPSWLHGHGDMYRKSFIYVPRGSLGLNIVLAEYDLPRSRRFVIRNPKGAVLFESDVKDGFLRENITFEKPGQYDDQLLTMEVSAGQGDFMVDVKHRFARDPEVKQRGTPAFSAVLAPDAATAKAIRGGAIYYDNRTFWNMYQVRFHDWLKNLKPEEFKVVDAQGNEIPALKLPTQPGFLNVNARYWSPPLCDHVMHHWPAHKNRAALNQALRDLAAGIRSVGPNDLVGVAVGGPFANMGYEFSNYAWHYWRPAFRVQQRSDAPEEVKQIVREAMIACGDRLAFCRTWARVNGNSFALIPSALRYCYAGTQDKMQEELFNTYWHRFTTGGWGKRVGIGPSGPSQESFGYAYHYASYITETWLAVLADFKDPRFKKFHDRILNWFSYTLADERVRAGAWSSRTHNYPHTSIQTEGPFKWKGLPGPDFTVSVNEGNEWFAARRKDYYVLTYHGRLCPKWNSAANAGQVGYGGGMLCQIQVPGKGPVIASTLNGEYGRGMHTSQWPSFHIHSVVGTTADGRPLVAADSEHFNAKLEGTSLSSSSEVRESSVHVTRGYTFGAKDISCTVQLRETGYSSVLHLWTPHPFQGKLREAYEMIPFIRKRQPPRKKGQPPIPDDTVTLIDAAGKSLGVIGQEPTEAKTIVIDRGGFGARIELKEPRPVHRGKNNTVMITLVKETTSANEIGLSYRIVPFGAE